MKLKKADSGSNDSDLPINERMEVCVAEAKLDLTQILEALPDARILAADTGRWVYNIRRLSLF